MTSGFDIEQYRAELERTSFDASRGRLAEHGWELVHAGENEVAAWKRFDAGLHEISLPTLDRLEEACREYDAVQETRERAARERAREHERLEQQTRLKAQLDRDVRQAESRWAEEEARKANL